MEKEYLDYEGTAEIVEKLTKELTRAEYDALSSAEKNNGTVYYITDEGGSAPSPSGSGAVAIHEAKNVYSENGIHGLRYYNNALQVQDATTGNWITIETKQPIELPFRFANGNAVLYNGEIHLLGGSLNNGTKHYKWNGEVWINVSTLPYNANIASCIVYNNEIHLLGGAEGATNHYKWDGIEWTSVETLPYDVYCWHNIVLYNNEIHLLGGNNSKTSHYKWDGTTWTSVSTLPYQFYEGNAIVYNGEIHIFGGGTYDGGDVDNPTKHYKWDGTAWTSVSTLPYDFSNSARAIVYNNEIHLIGNGTNHYKWDGTTWTSVSTLPFSFYGNDAVVHNGMIYIFGSQVDRFYYFNGESWKRCAS